MVVAEDRGEREKLHFLFARFAVLLHQPTPIGQAGARDCLCRSWPATEKAAGTHDKYESDLGRHSCQLVDGCGRFTDFYTCSQRGLFSQARRDQVPGLLIWSERVG